MARLNAARFGTSVARRRIRQGRGVAAALVLLFGFTACSALKEQAGLTKRAPDEFTVITKAPLIMPPDFSLRPPRPGAKGPQQIQPRERARTALFSAGRSAGAKPARGAGRLSPTGSASSGSATGNPTAAETALLRQAGALGVDPAIRQIINRETSVLAEKDSSFTDRLLFWQTKEPFGSAVDADKEARRLRQAAAAGEPPNKGKTPVIKRRKRGLLEGIF